MVTEEGNVGGTMFVDLSFHEKSMEDVSLLIRIAFTGHDFLLSPPVSWHCCYRTL